MAHRHTAAGAAKIATLIAMLIALLFCAVRVLLTRPASQINYTVPMETSGTLTISFPNVSPLPSVIVSDASDGVAIEPTTTDSGLTYQLDAGTYTVSTDAANDIELTKTAAQTVSDATPTTTAFTSASLDTDKKSYLNVKANVVSPDAGPLDTEVIAESVSGQEKLLLARVAVPVNQDVNIKCPTAKLEAGKAYRIAISVVGSDGTHTNKLTTITWTGNDAND